MGRCAPRRPLKVRDLNIESGPGDENATGFIHHARTETESSLKWRRALRLLFTIPRAGRSRVWAIAAWVTLVVCLAGTVSGTATFVANAHESNSASFENSVNQVSSAASLVLGRTQDLATATSAFLSQTPGFSASQFRRWTRAVYRPERFSGVEALFFIRYVRASQLSAYAASVKPKGSFKLEPPGDHPYYCFLPQGDAITTSFAAKGSFANIPVSTFKSSSRLAGVNLCATFAGPLFLASARDDRSAAGLFELSKRSFIVVPVYQRGTTPTGAQARTAEVLGWAGVLFDGRAAAQAAVHGQPHISLALSTRNKEQGSVRVGSVGSLRSHNPYHVTNDLRLENTWVLSVYGTSVSSPVALDTGEALILFGGVLISLMAWALLRLLPTRETRHWRSSNSEPPICTTLRCTIRSPASRTAHW